MKTPSIILIAGPSGSGKSTLAKGLGHHLQNTDLSTSVISLDNYYRDLTHLNKKQRSQHNFDEPDAWEHERIIDDVEKMQRGLKVSIPIYDFNSHLRADRSKDIAPCATYIFEGLFALCFPALNRLADLKIYVDLEESIALSRRILRDSTERGRSPESVIKQYEQTVRPANQNFICPSAKEADLKVSGKITLKEQLAALKPYLKR
ncbi:MAG: uridine kinase [Opitutales bacterium]